MATDSALTRRDEPRQLWQAPVFFLGVAVIIAVPLTRKHWRPHDVPAISRQLAQARQALEKSPPDPTASLQYARKTLESIDRFPQFAGEAHFLIGSAQLRLVDLNAPDAAALGQCRAHLEQADRIGVSDTDRPKLNYVLAKSAVLRGLEPAPALAALAQSIDAADDAAEAYGLLAQAHLKMEPPDLNAALEATKQQLAKASPATDGRWLAAARLRLGSLYLKMNNSKEGRTVLERIGNDSPPEVFFGARALLAENYETAHEWAKASRNWDQVRMNPRLTPAGKGAALYHWGRCLAQEQRVKEAASAWEEAATLPGDEGQAAALRLAEVRVESDPKAAADAFTTALNAVQSPGDYRNALVSIDEARQILERAASQCRAKGDIAAAQRLVDLYAKMAPPGRDDDLLAQSADASAQTLLDQAKQNPIEAGQLQEQARGQYLTAARAYERAAGKVSPGPEQAQWLWRSADRYLKAQQQQAALDVLTRMTQLETQLSPENIVEAWYQIAGIHHQKQQFAAARAAYQRCLTPPGRFTFPSRHQLALLDLVENKFDDAESLLQENRTALRGAAQPDAHLMEQTEYALAAVAFQRQTAIKEELREYTTAEQRYLGAIQQYPDSPEAVKARFHLGQCYWFVASQRSKALSGGTLNDEERKAYQKQFADNLQKASEQFEKIETTLANKQKSGPLTSDEAALLWRSSFSSAHCFFYMSQFEEAIRRYTALAAQYQGQIGELGALSQVFQSYVLTKQSDKAQTVMAQMKTVFEKMPETAFTGGEPSYHRSFWVQWFADAEKQFTP